MNRIYQGRGSKVEIPDLGHRPATIGRAPQVQPLDHSGIGHRSWVIGNPAPPQAHRLSVIAHWQYGPVQDAVNPLLRIGWGEGGGSRMR